MKGLAVVDGDLALHGGSLLTLSGVPRVRQDLTIAMTDEYGSDRMHPYWGSILTRFIGLPITETLQQRVINEVRRVLNNYIRVQDDQVKSASATGTRSTLDTSDVVRNITSIDALVGGGFITINVTLQTMARDSVTLTRTVTL